MNKHGLARKATPIAFGQALPVYYFGCDASAARSGRLRVKAEGPEMVMRLESAGA